MREVVTYIAYDDAEFDSREMALAYEKKHLMYLQEIGKTCLFFNLHRDIIAPPTWTTDIEAWAGWVEIAMEQAAYVHRINNFSTKVNDFIRYALGQYFCNKDFNNEIGWFKYDDYEDEWIKVDE